jgi:hypothetical protein
MSRVAPNSAIASSLDQIASTCQRWRRVNSRYMPDGTVAALKIMENGRADANHSIGGRVEC